MTANAPHLKYAQLSRRGYGVLDLRAGELLATFRSPTSVTDPAAPVETLARFRVGLREGAVERA